MTKFTVKLNFSSKDVSISKEFADYLSNAEGWRNLTGGVMAFNATESSIEVYGCNLPCEVKDNQLFIDGELMIDFTTESMNTELWENPLLK